MVFILDREDSFDVPLADVWKYYGSGDLHSRSHGHRKVQRRRFTECSGRYSWEQDFQGKPERFAMKWTVHHPVGIAYEVVGGPFAGSRFFLYYEPRGRRTGVTIAGEFVSPTISPNRLGRSVRQFFAKEFDQDREGLRSMVRSAG